jgi:elongation factor Ts
VHAGNKIGVLVAAKVGSEGALNSADFAKFHDDVAMQAAAMAPVYLGKADVPEEAKQKQSEIYDAQLVAENKPEKARPAIIKGKLDKWLKEICLLEQQSVIDNDKTVDQIRADLAKQLGTEIEIVRFVRFERGEGIEKPQGPDFAAEVAKMAGG